MPLTEEAHCLVIFCTLSRERAIPRAHVGARAGALGMCSRPGALAYADARELLCALWFGAVILGFRVWGVPDCSELLFLPCRRLCQGCACRLEDRSLSLSLCLPLSLSITLPSSLPSSLPVTPVRLPQVLSIALSLSVRLSARREGSAANARLQRQCSRMRRGRCWIFWTGCCSLAQPNASLPSRCVGARPSVGWGWRGSKGECERVRAMEAY